MKITKEKEISKDLVSFFSSLVALDPNIDPPNQVEILKVIPYLIKIKCWDPFLKKRKIFRLFAP